MENTPPQNFNHSYFFATFIMLLIVMSNTYNRRFTNFLIIQVYKPNNTELLSTVNSRSIALFAVCIKIPYCHHNDSKCIV